MSILDCLNGKIKEGIFTKEEIANIRKRHEAELNDLRSHMSEADAQTTASIRTMEREVKRLERERFNDARSLIMQNQIWDSTMKRAMSSKSKMPDHKKLRLAYEEILEKAYARKNTVKKEYYRLLDEVFEKFKTDKFTGLFRENPIEEFQDMVRVALGEKPLDKTNEAGGKALREVFQYAHKRIEAAGAIIGKQPDFFPQNIHLSKKVGKVSYTEWRKDVMRFMDLRSITNPKSGMRVSAAQLDELLPNIYNNIKSGGKLAEINATAKNLPEEFKDIDLNRADRRFFKFKNADAFFEYNNKYGYGPEGLYDLFLNYLDKMARDTANLEVLGPRPKSLHDNMMRRFKTVGGKTGEAGRNWIDGQFRVLTGQYDGAPDSPIIKALGNVQNILRSAYLGGAGLAAVGDSTFIVATARLKGLPVTEAIGNYGKLLSPFDNEVKKMARDNGYILEMVARGNIVDHKFAADNMGGAFTSAIANAVIKASGLEHVTKAARDAISLSMESNTARLIDSQTSWSAMAPEMRDMFESHGITSGDWEIIQKIKPHRNPDNGVAFLRASDIYRADLGNVKLPENINPKREFLEKDFQKAGIDIEDINSKIDDLLEKTDTESQSKLVNLRKQRKKLIDKRNTITETLKKTPKHQAAKTVPVASSKKLHEIASNYDDLIENLRDMVSNEASLKVRALSTGAAFGNAGPNSILRAFSSSAFMFKTFPIQVMFNHLFPGFRAVLNQKGRGGYEHLMTTLVGGTIMGAAIFQLKSIAQGKEPADMDNWKFWRAAFLQSGSGGLAGDMFMNEHGYGSGPFLATLKGPVVGTLDDGWMTFEKNFKRLSEGKETKFFADSFRFLRKRTPGQNLLPTKLLFERLFFDEIEKMLDPDFTSRQRRIRNRNIDDYNQDYYFRPGGSFEEAGKNILRGLELGSTDVLNVDSNRIGTAEGPLSLPDMGHYAALINQAEELSVQVASSEEDIAKQLLISGAAEIFIPAKNFNPNIAAQKDPHSKSLVVQAKKDYEKNKKLIIDTIKKDLGNDIDVDLDFISKGEGGLWRVVYNPQKGSSGGTVGVGGDLGQTNKAELDRYAPKGDLNKHYHSAVKKIKSLFKKPKAEANTILKENAKDGKPLQLTEKEAVAITVAFKKKSIAMFKRNAANAGFDLSNMPKNVQTAAADIVFQWGNIHGRSSKGKPAVVHMKKVWRALAEGSKSSADDRWFKAKKLLLQDKSGYSQRDRERAQLIEPRKKAIPRVQKVKT